MKQEKAVPQENEQQGLTNYELVAEVLATRNLSTQAKEAEVLMLVELKQVKVPVFRQLCKEISFGTSILCHS